MKKFRVNKSLVAILLGVAVTGLSTSAFAATCQVPTHSADYNWASYGYTPYVQAVPQYQQAAPQYWQAAPQYQQVVRQYDTQVLYAAPQYRIQAQYAAPQQPVNYSAAPANNSQDQAQNVSSDQVNTEILNLVNQERTKAGLKPVSLDNQLSKVAMDKAKDMANNHYFDHISPTYGSPFDMMTRAGIQSSTAGENIAMGQRSSQEVMTQWMNSQGHRENILNPNFTKIGIASYNGYWVQEFIG